MTTVTKFWQLAVYCGILMHPKAKMAKEVNRTCHLRNTMVPLLTPTPTPSATIDFVKDRRDRQMDGQTDNSIMPLPAANHNVCLLLFTCVDHKWLKFRIQIAWTDSIGCSKRTVAMPRNLFVSLSIFSSTCNTLPAIRNISSNFSAVTM